MADPDTTALAELTTTVAALAGLVRELTVTVHASSPGALLTLEEMAERTRISPRTLKDLAMRGRIPHHRIGKHYRFSAEDITELLHATQKQPRNTRAGLLGRIAA
jgi:excisionase family DNA binding protein